MGGLVGKPVDGLVSWWVGRQMSRLEGKEENSHLRVVNIMLIYSSLYFHSACS